MPIDPIAQALLEAADVVEKCSGLYKAGHERFGTNCAGLALAERADARFLIGGSERNAFFRECGDRLGLLKATDPDLQFSRIVAWNDAPERTKDEVVAALREAARS